MTGNRRMYHHFKVSFLFAGMVILFSVTHCIPFEPEGFLQVTTDSVLSNSNGSYSLNGTVEEIGIEEITEHGFCWSELPLPTMEGPSSRLGPKSTIGSFSSSISGLDLGRTYNFRAFAYSSSDTVYGEVKSIRTGTNGIPAADFIASRTAITEGESITFTDQSTNNPESWSWSFGDGNTSKEQNPTHIYSLAGKYSVSLIATNSNGSDTVTKSDYITVVVKGTVVAAFSADKTDVLVGEVVHFTDQSVNNPTSWIWTFGDGDTAISQHPSHSYGTTGTYTVSLTATNANGSHTEIKTDYISVTTATIPPVATFSANKTTVTPGESVTFTDHSTNNPESWSWNFGDGNTSVIQHPTHSYTTQGTYTVTLTVTNSAGNDTETKSNYITVVPGGSAPVAGFTANRTTIAEGESVTFTDQSLNSPTEWSWNFGDGTTSTARNPAHTYNSAGTYTVSLNVSNSYGSDDEIKPDYITVTGTNQGTVTDKDGNTYNTVKIGTQWWMAENLKTTSYNNGNPIPQETGTSEWEKLSTPAYCWFENNETTYKNQYGALYNGFAVETGNLCPAGWHIPSDKEWKTLEIYIGMSSSAADDTDWRGTDEGTKLKATFSWDSGGNGTDKYGFRGLAGGYRSASGSFSGLGLGELMWSSTEMLDTRLYYRTLGSLQSGIERWYLSKNCGFAVRCVKD